MNRSNQTEIKEYLSNLIAHAPYGVITIDLEGYILIFNSYALELLQLPGKENHYIDQHILTLSQSIPALHQILEENLQLGRKAFSLENVQLKNNYLNIKGRLLINGMLLSFEDVTQRYLIESQLQQLNTALEQKIQARTLQLELANQKMEESLKREKQINELKSRFISIASHEFRTPLTAISSSTGLIARYTKENDQEKRMKHVYRIRENIQTLNGVLNDFLSLDRLNSGEIQLNFSFINTEEYITGLLKELSLIKQKEQQIIYQHKGDDKNTYIDIKALRSIVFNLISNAIKYSQSHGVIHIHSHISNNNLHLCIQDFGMGIPQQDQNKLFTRFFRASNVQHISGTGLGLTIVKRYLDLMQGQINYTSKFQKGTTFKLMIPSPK